MTDEALNAPSYLIVKRGYYYRPNEQGYTSSAIQAGRYTLTEAEKITHPNGVDGPRDGMTFIHEDEVNDEDWKAYTTLRAQLAEAHTRIEAMESGDWSELKLVRFENGQMDITAGPIPAIAEYLAQMMQDGEGKYFNFMEVSINHNTAGPMTLSLQRKNGKTPNQLRKEAEARADRAEAALARVKG